MSKKRPRSPTSASSAIAAFNAAVELGMQPNDDGTKSPRSVFRGSHEILRDISLRTRDPNEDYDWVVNVFGFQSLSYKPGYVITLGIELVVASKPIAIFIDLPALGHDYKHNSDYMKSIMFYNTDVPTQMLCSFHELLMLHLDYANINNPIGQAFSKRLRESLKLQNPHFELLQALKRAQSEGKLIMRCTLGNLQRVLRAAKIEERHNPMRPHMPGIIKKKLGVSITLDGGKGKLNKSRKSRKHRRS